ncbi:MAG: AI-2E family transporter [Thiogranum sp.]|nr:AI-2E family transporter [Thiogranum sp.]
MELLRRWFVHYFSNPQVVILVLLLLVGFVVVLTMGQMLAPVLAALVLAYLLEGIINFLQRHGVPRIWAVVLVFIAFMFFLTFALLGLLPRLSYQVSQLVQQLPHIISRGQDAIMALPQSYPELFSEQQVRDVVDAIRAEVGNLGQNLLTLSLASVVGVITLMVYLILVPVLVFFFLKDKERIIHWLTAYLPDDRALTTRVWHEVDIQIGNYVRGKIWEILLVGSVTYLTFVAMNLQYAVLLATLVGLSVVIPYIGAAAVTIPIAAIAWFQWGWSPEFGYVLIAYGIIQALDGNVLVPLLFSEVVNLHPVAIIIAVLVFGGIWGFWGVFFAIPLATLVQAVLRALPRVHPSGESVSEPVQDQG